MHQEQGRVRPGATVGEVGERALIALFTAAAAGSSDDVVIGSGDDAAVLAGGGAVVVSTDTAVAGRHFRFDWSTAEQIGARAVVQSAADIAAMGGTLTGTVVSIGCPPETPVPRVLALNAGIVAQTHRLGGRVLGGDLVSAPSVILTVTSLGTLSGTAPVTLAGARAGDVLAVSGPLGGAAAGLAVLSAIENGADPVLAARFPQLVQAYRLPQPDLAQGPIAARAGAHAMTDISDALVEEIITMSAGSGLHLDVESAMVPRPAGLDELAAELGVDPVRWALTGGEDHQLLAAFAPGGVPGGWTVVGTVAAPAAGRPAAATVDGATADGLHGWQSFSEA
ncbi:thiamine-monophosphate kinase [Gordonia hirsuta DSM 44140 = NBRC 16056]|uniref:Thiamine-monophosphate kinase n=1 Tax=Gordonia hirsuta DSM 44140 = NBRC 16056 TaxID=1121927 RepID=L7L8Z8_9ACTN|nr:thiamine-phosphate kinase [Gordonia hirsuta]GAC57236.1 thiamine-monophosphate kinase [Gordonia hirsuta DSM 44140 = NBRC 16056]